VVTQQAGDLQGLVVGAGQNGCRLIGCRSFLFAGQDVVDQGD